MAHVLTELRVVPQMQGREAVELARELGLQLQAERYAKPLAEHAFKPLNADEITLWRHHCPTRYIPGGDANTRALEQYAFDSVPVEVLRHWKAVKDAYAFDRYEIWTTERTPNADPLLIGVLGQGLFMLARWGLESPEQMPLREIAQRIYDEGCAQAMKYPADYPFQSAAKKLESNLRWVRGYSSTFGAAERVLGIKGGGSLRFHLGM